MNIQYCFRCLGINIPDNCSCPKNFRDFLILIHSTFTPGHDLNKKHTVNRFYAIYKSVATGIIEPYWIRSEKNTSDMMIQKS